MVDLMYALLDFSFDFLTVLVFFAVLVFIGKYAFRFLKNMSRFKSSRFFNPQEYLPEEELSTIRQVIYLIMIVILAMNILYLIFGWRGESFNMLLFDIIISLYLAIHVEASSLKGIFILFLLVPFGSIAELMAPFSYVMIFDFIHFFVFLYFIKLYYDKFLEFTETNHLGITIMLLFMIVFISFFITIAVEGVTPLDSIEMVSNAFTSNGYSILGTSAIGKMNAIFLVWAGFIMSGVGTATLTVAIVMEHVDGKFDHLEDIIRKKRE